MDDSERAASAVNMIEERLKNGGRRREEAQQPQPNAASTGIGGSFTARTGAGTATGAGEAISASQPEAEQQII